MFRSTSTRRIDMYRVGRTAWGLVAIGAATAVGITTHSPGFIAITFVGTLVLPRVLGLTPRRRGWRGFGPAGFGPRGAGCGGAGHKASEPEASTPTAQSV
jgi:hypothetical protein